MKTLEIKLGSVNDIKKIYYLINLDDYAYLEHELIHDEFSADAELIYSYRLIVKLDNGIYPGTVEEMLRAEYNGIIQKLLELEIIKKIIAPDSSVVYIAGQNYGKENLTSAAAATLGKKGGSVKSERKAQAVRENGKKGGRPRKLQS